MRTTDNRDLSEMEAFYLARIDALNRALLEANNTIELLRADVRDAEQWFAKLMEKGA